MTIGRKVLGGWLLAVACVMLLSGAQAAAPLALAPVCFDGAADHSFLSERLSVQIKKMQQEGLVYFLCDVQVAEPSQLRAGLSQDKKYGSYEAVSDIAARHHAVLAFNGDCYGFHRNGVIIRNGELFRAKASDRHLLYVDAEGNLGVVSDRKEEKPEALGKRLMVMGASQAWEFGPALVRDGQAIALPEKFSLQSTREDKQAPRTGIGQIAPLHYVVIVVDGRQKGYSGGISLPQLQRLFVSAGAQTAFNLDGGGSTTLYFHGEVLNQPSAGSERRVSDIVFF